jgi:hypothetical protein
VNRPNDILNDWRTASVLYGLPILAIAASGLPGVGGNWRTGIWVSGLAVMGAACIFNALRCGRVHCYLTGPFLIVMAIVALWYGLGRLPLGEHGWSTISLAVIAGTLLLWCLPELFFGRYRRRRAS